METPGVCQVSEWSRQSCQTGGTRWVILEGSTVESEPGSFAGSLRSLVTRMQPTEKIIHEVLLQRVDLGFLHKHTGYRSSGLEVTWEGGHKKGITQNNHKEICLDQQELPLQVNTQALECWQRWVLMLLS
ncbi:hypothetical protein ILYODFUR_034700 [Ilyodon furcidens]|uniref:Uncharacterized protein n=1 Tax=Ilyodon furcidens TaxID=33524 RepID=A0ABV0UMM4_9TELE